MQELLQAAKDLNYPRIMSARSLRSGKALTVLFYFFLRSLDYRPSACLFEMFVGISIFLPASVSTQLDASNGQRHCVPLNHSKRADLAIRFLRDMGHRNVAIISGPPDHLDSLARMDGSKFAMTYLRLPIKVNWVKQGDFGVHDGFECMNEILASGDVPTAVFCFNDQMVVGAMGAVRIHGLRVPEDLSIIGFDSWDVAETSFLRLTSVRQPIFNHGQTAARMLLDLIKGNPVKDPFITIEPTLDACDSVMKLTQLSEEIPAS